MKANSQERIRTLASLEAVPEEQAAYARTLLEPKLGLEAVRAAVGVLAKHPMPDTRDGLHSLYRHYAAHNGTRDPGTYTRSAVLKALRPIMNAKDTDLVVGAVSTYEFLPPAFTEEAALLRSTALVMLNELDERLARYFATRLLADGHTDRMSGEPAMTAVRVLASLEELMPLYFYVVQQSESGNSEVAAECLRCLAGAPDVVVDQLVAQYAQSDDTAALVGLFDLLLAAPDEARHVDYLANFLRETDDLDLYRYLVTVMVTSTSPNIRQSVADATRFERQSGRINVLQEALAIATDAPELATLRASFERQGSR